MPKTVEVSYSVREVSVIPLPGVGSSNMIAITLVRLFEEKGETRIQEIQPTNLSRTEEEQIAQKMVTAGMSAALRFMAPPNSPVLHLTWEEYEKLGKPTINDVLTVTLEAKIGADA